MCSNARLVMYHKHPVSARLQFLKMPGNTVCAFEALPALSDIVDESAEGKNQHGISLHPKSLVLQAENLLQLQRGVLSLEKGALARIDTPGGLVSVYLARFDTTDPPFAEAEKAGAIFVGLNEARDLNPVELELLRRAYVLAMEG